MKRAPWPVPPLSARMRPPCASTRPLRDREPEPGASGGAGALPEEMREPVGRDAPALVRDRERDVAAFGLRLDADRRRRRRACRAAFESRLFEHLGDALGVGHRPREVGRQVDEDGVAASAAQERVPGPVHQHGDAGRLGRDRERAGLDAPGI